MNKNKRLFFKKSPLNNPRSQTFLSIFYFGDQALPPNLHPGSRTVDSSFLLTHGFSDPDPGWTHSIYAPSQISGSTDSGYAHSHHVYDPHGTGAGTPMIPPGETGLKSLNASTGTLHLYCISVMKAGGEYTILHIFHSLSFRIRSPSDGVVWFSYSPTRHSLTL